MLVKTIAGAFSNYGKDITTVSKISLIYNPLRRPANEWCRGSFSYSHSDLYNLFSSINRSKGKTISYCCSASGHYKANKYMSSNGTEIHKSYSNSGKGSW